MVQVYSDQDLSTKNAPSDIAEADCPAKRTLTILGLLLEGK
jgi:hypothetical protein